MLVRVVGGSMQPRLQPGEFVLSVPGLEVRVGDLVLFRVGTWILVKEVERLRGDRVELKGWGYVLRGALIGRVVLSWPPRSSLRRRLEDHGNPT
jgi:signal peptidase I